MPARDRLQQVHQEWHPHSPPQGESRDPPDFVFPKLHCSTTACSSLEAALMSQVYIC